jgi:3-hydroxyacyl-CoA dehydrogenase
MAEAGYTQPIHRTDVKVLGKQALGMFLVGTDQMEAGKYISEHDKKIANKLAYVMAGGDLSEATLVSERYLLEEKLSCLYVLKEKHWKESNTC